MSEEGPEVIPADREKDLEPWVQAQLLGLRADFSSTHAIGVQPDGLFVAWRNDGTGEPLTASDPFSLRQLVGADRYPVCTEFPAQRSGQ